MPAAFRRERISNTLKERASARTAIAVAENETSAPLIHITTRRMVRWVTTLGPRKRARQRDGGLVSRVSPGRSGSPAYLAPSVP